MGGRALTRDNCSGRPFGRLLVKNRVIDLDQVCSCARIAVAPTVRVRGWHGVKRRTDSS
jgi:hypothetical protein